MNEVEAYIYYFLEYIILFNKSLVSAYDLEIYPTYNEAGRLYPRKGEVNLYGKKFDYNYHGSGCTLLVDGIIVDYDLDILSLNKIKISDWKFNRFIEGYSKGNSNISIEDLDGIFIQLSQKGILERRISNVLVFNINESYFKDYIPSL